MLTVQDLPHRDPVDAVTSGKVLDLGAGTVLDYEVLDFLRGEPTGGPWSKSIGQCPTLHLSG